MKHTRLHIVNSLSYHTRFSKCDPPPLGTQVNAKRSQPSQKMGPTISRYYIFQLGMLFLKYSAFSDLKNVSLINFGG